MDNDGQTKAKDRRQRIYGEKFDALLVEFKQKFDTLKTEMEEALSSIENGVDNAKEINTLHEEVVSTAEEIKNEYEALFEDKNDNDFSVIEEIKDSHTKVTKFYLEASEAAKEIETLKNTANESSEIIEQTKETAIEQAEELNDAFTEVFVVNENEKISKWAAVSDYYKKVSKWHNEIDEFQKNLFGYEEERRTQLTEEEVNELPDDEMEEDEDGFFYQVGVRKVEGLKEKFEQEVKELEQRAIRQKKEYDQLIADIEDILPRATSAGLVGTYKKAQEDHEKILEKWHKFFYITMCGLLIVAGVGGWYYNNLFDDGLSLTRQFLYLLKILPFELPLIFLVFFTSRKISQHSRLVEEYRHKGTVATNFVGLRTEAEKISATLPETCAHHKLYTHTLDSYSDNPSETLDSKRHDETPLHTFLKQVTKCADAVKCVQEITQTKTEDNGKTAK